ncbi:hypothetical protein NQZ68_032560 [Dissostichus eleginoides]|nr:hypothetical protein NQZ68_032560 [Dissostichus eleginoides]
MPICQRSGNSNSSHLRLEPAELAASTLSRILKSTSQSHWSLNKSCEVCLEASCGGASLRGRLEAAFPHRASDGLRAWANFRKRQQC